MPVVYRHDAQLPRRAPGMGESSFTVIHHAHGGSVMRMETAPQRLPEPADILGMIGRSLTNQQARPDEHEYLVSIQAGTGQTAAVVTTSRGEVWAIRVERIS